MAQETDWVGEWFAINRENGINDICGLGRIDLRTGEVKWNKFSHAEMDGPGALRKILEEEGYIFASWERLKNQRQPGIVQSIARLRRFAGEQGPKHVTWLHGNSQEAPVWERIALTVFTEEETRELTRHARVSERSSLNSYLLSVMNRLVFSELVAPGTQSISWLVPVDMRGGVERQNVYSNHASGMAVPATATSGALELHEKIKRNLQQGAHWATWWGLQIGRFVGKKGMRWLSARSRQKSFWAGTFSNMGEWPPPSDLRPPYNPHEAWACISPGSANYPIGVGLLTWQGKLSVALKIHPHACADFERVQTLLKRFREEALFPCQEKEEVAGQRTLIDDTRMS